MTSDQERIERLEQRVSQLIDLANKNRDGILKLSEAGSLTAEVIEGLLKRMEDFELTMLMDQDRLYKEGKA